MKITTLILLVVICCGRLQAQNNPIFGGGGNDGWNKAPYMQVANNIFSGGAADGWNYKAYVQSVNHIYNGGNNDGWGLSAYKQNTNNIFGGGQGDGWTFKPHQQKTNNIYCGGVGDGWSFTLYQQSVNNIYPGGNGDGWSYKTYGQTSSNIFAGGQGDGWASTYRPLRILPVTFIDFTAKKQAGNSLLNWQTANEVNSASFDIERSIDAVHFAKLGSVIAAGTSNTDRSYEFVDSRPVSGYNYYRLKQLDRNGAFVYTPTRMVWFDLSSLQLIKAYPVPTLSLLTVELPVTLQAEDVIVNLSNALGVMVQHIRLPNGRATNKQVLNLAHLPPGAYTLQISSQSFNGSRTIIKQ
ncbi:MAG TPA: T9SS type A sorting domain-containing protein [Flavisolibacter sp.]|nr:T9SS type A sorting domain-containing protein [Flavisolibacter sp.]